MAVGLLPGNRETWRAPRHLEFSKENRNGAQTLASQSHKAQHAAAAADGSSRWHVAQLGQDKPDLATKKTTGSYSLPTSYRENQGPTEGQLAICKKRLIGRAWADFVRPLPRHQVTSS